MHRSRLGTGLVDCGTDDLDAAASFWARALGWGSTRLTDPADANYRRLETPRSEVQILVQSVTHPSRVHLDVETDDVEAEVRRLEQLGAQRVVQTKRLMQSPTGQRFCVVPPQRHDFDSAANTWEDP